LLGEIDKQDFLVVSHDVKVDFIADHFKPGLSCAHELIVTEPSAFPSSHLVSSPTIRTKEIVNF
jgi:hypothetical protein